MNLLLKSKSISSSSNRKEILKLKPQLLLRWSKKKKNFKPMDHRVARTSIQKTPAESISSRLNPTNTSSEITLNPSIGPQLRVAAMKPI